MLELPVVLINWVWIHSAMFKHQEWRAGGSKPDEKWPTSKRKDTKWRDGRSVNITLTFLPRWTSAEWQIRHTHCSTRLSSGSAVTYFDVDLQSSPWNARWQDSSEDRLQLWEVQEYLVVECVEVCVISLHTHRKAWKDEKIDSVRETVRGREEKLWRRESNTTV